MEASTNIRDMLAGNQISVPAYQRAYSWDTEFDLSKKPKQVNQFLLDLEEYRRSSATSPYYFGHFLFEEKEERQYDIVDGQQRLTTIIIFISALFKQLSELNELSDDLQDLYEDLVKRRKQYRFQTVDYDRLVFKDYIIDKVSVIDKELPNSIDTESKRRFLLAFKFFEEYFNTKCTGKDLIELLHIVVNASCTTHSVKDESEAIQMFIFQNNRGKRPTNLEIIKAEFMFHIHLYANEERDSLLEEIKSRFETIYKSISAIEYKMNEDDVLRYTIRVYANSLWEDEPQEWISRQLKSENAISFIQNFTFELSESFKNLNQFFTKDEKTEHKIHSFVSLGQVGIAMPFILKAYKFALSTLDKARLCEALECILLRHRLLGTRAELNSRLNDVYQEFNNDNKSIEPIVSRINDLKISNEWWWNHWNNESIEYVLNSNINNHHLAKILLWKYENYLESQGANGYKLTRFDEIESPELEHISPVTKPNEDVASGYADYDDEFKEEYLNCLGNFLLISKSHNCSIGNKAFKEKRESYNNNRLAQQREVYSMTEGKRKWSKTLIDERHNKIVEFLMTVL